MPKLIATVTERFLPRARRLLSSRRRGSILIMVVAVLVLLALMGTAYISTARLDRQAAEQVNQATAQEVIEQLLPAIEDTAERVIVEDVLTLAQGYRPPFILGVSTYDHWDSPITNYYDSVGAPPTGIALNDAWLGSRAPEELGNPNWPPNSRVLTWRTISRPITQPMIPASGTLPAEELFFSPYRDPTLTLPAPPNPLAKYPQWTQDALTQRMAISELTITYPTPFSEPSLEGKTRVFPALMPVTLAGDPLPSTATRIRYLAADADGDGIADSGLVPIMDGEIGGVRYFYAVRIIDHGSAVNVNTARARGGDFSEGAPAPDMPNRAMFASNIGLAEMLVTFNGVTGMSAEMDELNRFKYGYLVGTAPPFSLNLSSPWEEWPNNNPVDRGPDFKFADPTNPLSLFGQGNADWFMRGMRLNNPGIRDPQTLSDSTDDLEYRAFPWADSASLAYRGGTMIVPRSSDPTINAGRPTGDLERAFYDGGLIAAAHDSVYRSAPNYMPSLNNRFTFFPTDKGNYWYRYIWDSSSSRATDWNNPGTNPDASMLPLPALPVRGLLTARNPVSNSINLHAEAGGNVPHDAMLPYNHEGRWSPYRGYAINDIVLWGAPAAAFPPTLPDAYQPTAAYICIEGYGAPTLPITEPIPQQPAYAAPTANWARIIPRGQHVAGVGYMPGHAVRTDGVAGRQVWICKAATAAAPVAGAAAWYALPLGETPPKVSLNTAPFAELFRGFYNVMADMSPQRTPFDVAIEAAITAGAATPDNVRGNDGPGMPGTFNNPYYGNRFMDQAAAVPFDRAPAASTAIEPQAHPAAMFRSPIRAIPHGAAPLFNAEQPRLPADQVLLLRSAIAAVNAEDMRDRDMNVTARMVQLQAHFGPDAGVSADRQPVNAVVYGSEPQPFISEVFISNDPRPGIANPSGYVAVELHNPYPFPIPLAGYRLVAIDRDPVTPAGANPGEVYLTHDPVLIADFSLPADVNDGAGGVVASIPANGYLLLENSPVQYAIPPVPGSAGLRPPSSGLPEAAPFVPQATTVVAYCPGLSDLTRTVFNKEMQLVKRRQWDGLAPSTGVYDVTPGGVAYSEDPLVNPNWLLDMVPVDAFDFTGIDIPAPAPAIREEWHYFRQSALAPWKFVYPGRYDGSLSSPPAARARQAGTQEETWDENIAGDLNEWDPTIAPPPPDLNMSLGHSYIGGMYVAAPNGSGTASYPRPFTIQWANGNFEPIAAPDGAHVGFNRVNPAGGNLFPFGGFMRNGDVLHVPFIGAYIIRPVPIPPGPAPVPAPPAAPPGAWFFEINPVTMDAAMAEDSIWFNDEDLIAPATGAYDEYREQVGRFFPPSAPAGVMPATAYEWASDVLDHFTAIQNPHDDFYANVDPTRYPDPTGGPRTLGVSSDGGNAANTNIDQDVPIEGMINVNTASASVLSTLPLVVNPTNGQVIPDQTRAMAEAIVHHRDVDGGSGVPHGPFKTLFELNQVIDQGAPGQGFRNMWNNMPIAGDSNDFHGDYTPVLAPTDGVTTDYEERYGQLIRLSNLITTRSDAFTVYVLVQGWKNVGTEYPVLVAERRSAFIADRSRINSTNGALNVVPVPTR